MEARIFRPVKTAMQSGQANTRMWRLELVQESPEQVDSLMGWTSSADTGQQVSLKFDSEEAAVEYCERHGIPYRLVTPRERKLHVKSYADNFSFHRVR